jgi:hypothetical protein
VRTQERLEDGWEAVKSRVDDSGLQLRKKCSGERGLDEPEGERTNRRVSRVANGEAELTGATDATGTQRRSWNGRQTSVNGSGAVWCARRAREGARELG